MEEPESILEYLAMHSPQTTFKIASALRINRTKLIAILDRLGKEGKVEFRTGLVLLAKKLPSKLEKSEAGSEVKSPETEVKKIEDLKGFSTAEKLQELDTKIKILVEGLKKTLERVEFQ